MENKTRRGIYPYLHDPFSSQLLHNSVLKRIGLDSLSFKERRFSLPVEEVLEAGTLDAGVIGVVRTGYEVVGTLNGSESLRCREEKD